ncbi:MAG: hypothetical protein RJQ00_02130 [Vicingaceae bacterium]
MPTPTVNIVLDEIQKRNFEMGFISWHYFASLGSQDSNYAFLRAKGEI